MRSTRKVVFAALFLAALAGGGEKKSLEHLLKSVEYGPR